MEQKHEITFSNGFRIVAEDYIDVRIIGNLLHIAKQMKKDYDYCLAITGRKRRGKSTLAYLIAYFVASIFGSKVWLCYDYHELREALFEAGEHDVIIADESISFLSSLKWFSPEAIEFTELFDRMGYKKLFVILIIPSFKSFVKGFREDRLDCHIWLSRRGEAKIFPVKETHEGCIFPKKPVDTGYFKPLPDEIENEYRTIKEESLKKRREAQVLYSDCKRKLQEINNFLRGEGYNQEERSKIFGFHPRTIRRWDAKDRRG